MALPSEVNHDQPSERPDPTAMPVKDWAARILGTWFGCGLLPHAPGTFGTLGALPLYALLRRPGESGKRVAIATVVLTGVGIWAGDAVARQTGEEDPQIVVIDEVVGVLIALLAAPTTWQGTLSAVALFRLFDIVKPWPVREFERLPGGLGIMFDDVAAGLMAAGVILAARKLSSKK